MTKETMMTMDSTGGSPRATGADGVGEGRELTPDELLAVAGGAEDDHPPSARPGDPYNNPDD